MKLKVKDMDISSGVTLVAVFNKHDAELLDLHLMDRVKIIKGNKIETVVVDIAQNSKVIKQGCVYFLTKL